MRVLRILVALGGNAILQRSERGTSEEQFINVRRACKHLVEIIKLGHTITITHGNGPQVGDILLKDESAREILPPMPLDVCGAESQGMIGYMIQQSLRNELAGQGLDLAVATILTETVVDPDAAAFRNPSKPIGPFYASADAARFRAQKGWQLVSDSGRGFRRVVPSPLPVTIVQGRTIKSLADEGTIVIAAGGGGIPVTSGVESRGLEAVIDKDLGAALLANLIGADVLLILTDVENVFLNYGLQNQTALKRVTIGECRRYISEGQFAKGSMLPKVEAAIRFIESGGKAAIISSLESSKSALEGAAGTTLVS